MNETASEVPPTPFETAGVGDASRIEAPAREPMPPISVLEVIIDGVCQVRVPSGFDMEAAARLIRSLAGERSNHAVSNG